MGHQYGDILLKNISSGLKQIPGVNDNCYRMGGDEFIILISHKVYPNLHNIIDRIKAEFETEEYEYYRTKKIPTTGHFIQEKDKTTNHLPGQMALGE